MNELKTALETIRSLLRDEAASHAAAIARRDYLASAEKILLGAINLAARVERQEQELADTQAAKVATEQEITSLRREIGELSPKRSELLAQVADLGDRLAAADARERKLNEREEKIEQREKRFADAAAQIRN